MKLILQYFFLKLHAVFVNHIHLLFVFTLKKCKQIAQSKEDDDVIVNKPHVSDEEEEEPPFYHHPFKLSEPKPIFFNLNVSISKVLWTDEAARLVGLF